MELTVKDYINLETIDDQLWEFSQFLEKVLMFMEGIKLDDGELQKFLENQEPKMSLLHIIDLYFKYKKYFEKKYERKD